MLNPGISFGLFPSLPIWLFSIILLGLIIYALKMRELVGRIGLVMIIVGGVGNLMSRIIYGGVVDNLNLFGLVYNNPSDYLIFFGLIIYGYTYFIRRR